MPRSARIDLPGLLQHVIVRGVAREAIFRDSEDRERFCARLSSLLADAGTECLAWALLSNHVHLLLRRWDVPLSTFMRRLLTGYAVTFNKRHGRSGHLFQNRYKSIVCEEEPYLLELVRYIHLNPVRAGLVPGVEGLRRYRWSGHAVLMGSRELPGQAVEAVLGRFGRTVREARQEYERFVAAGVNQGRRDELVGGGLRRSLKILGPSKEREAYDERVLGSGEFVEELWRREELRDVLRPPWTVDEVVERVAVRHGLDPERVLRRSTDPRVSDARGLVCHVGVDVLGLKATEVGRILGLGRSGASRCLARGRKVAREKPEVLRAVLGENPVEGT